MFFNPTSGQGNAARSVFKKTISGSTQIGNLKTYMNGQGYKGQRLCILEIASGGKAYPPNTSTGGIDCNHADWNVGTQVWILMKSGGEITGRGGASGSAGGPGIHIDTPSKGVGFCFILDSGSELNGGGGGGSTGAHGGSCTNYGGKFCDGSSCSCPGGAGGTGYGPNAATSGSGGTSCSCSGGCGSCAGGTGVSGGTKGTASTYAAGNASTGKANAALWANNATVNGSES